MCGIIGTSVHLTKSALILAQRQRAWEIGTRQHGPYGAARHTEGMFLSLPYGLANPTRSDMAVRKSCGGSTDPDRRIVGRFLTNLTSVMVGGFAASSLNISNRIWNTLSMKIWEMKRSACHHGVAFRVGKASEPLELWENEQAGRLCILVKSC